MKLITLVVFILGLITKGNCQSSPRVNTHSGLIIGSIENTVLKSIPYESYRGIPYAEPILDNSQRFKPPKPIKPWGNQPLYATANKDRCLQLDKGEIVGSEDCLYLNVYVPKGPSQTTGLKPVIAWIHGGAFTTGNGNSTYYGPDFLLEEDVIVLSVQYRLGALGFLNVNHPNATGNMGLKDQNLALRWAKKNIQFFGGDPNKITLFGQSAGGVSVDLHKLSDMSIGLFTQTISMSASPLCKYWPFQSNADARTIAFSLGKRLGINTADSDQLLNHLSNVPSSEIVKTSATIPGIPFRPTLENAEIALDEEKFLTECTPKKYKEGNYTKGPHLMGFTSTEILEFVNSLDDLIRYCEDAANSIKGFKYIKSLPVVPSVLSASLSTIENMKKDALQELIKEVSNIYFATGIDMKQRLLSNNNEAPIYYYVYDFHSPHSAHKSEGIQFLDGVAHEDELPHIFYRPHLEIPLLEPEIKQTRERLVRMWANFAKTGNPTPYGEKDPLLNLTWPDSRGTGTHLSITNNLRVIEDRPTDVLVTLYQKFGFGDCSIYNDCDKNLLNDIVNNVVNIPTKVEDILAGSKNSVSGAWNATKNTVNGAKNIIAGTASTIVEGGKATVVESAKGVASMFNKTIGGIKSIFRG